MHAEPDEQHQKHHDYAHFPPEGQQPDFTLDDLDFLDTFSATEPSQDFWFGGNGGQLLDLGFGTGGTNGGWDPEAGNAWDLSGESAGAGGAGGFDLYDGFYFGHANGSSNGGGAGSGGL